MITRDSLISASDSGDVASPEALVEAAYRYISFAAGGEPRWDAFRNLFAPRAVLALRVFPEDKSVTVMTLEEYIRIQMREGLKESGYTERPVGREVKQTKDIAEILVRFQMFFGETKAVDALDIFQACRINDRWYIVSILSEILTAAPNQS